MYKVNSNSNNDRDKDRNDKEDEKGKRDSKISNETENSGTAI